MLYCTTNNTTVVILILQFTIYTIILTTTTATPYEHGGGARDFARRFKIACNVQATGADLVKIAALGLSILLYNVQV